MSSFNLKSTMYDECIIVQQLQTHELIFLHLFISSLTILNVQRIFLIKFENFHFERNILKIYIYVIVF